MEAKLLEQILTYLGEELGGEWLLTGGSLVRIGHPSLSDEAARNALFRWLIDRGLGPEWVTRRSNPSCARCRAGSRSWSYCAKARGDACTDPT
jgi:hypothetical protein